MVKRGLLLAGVIALFAALLPLSVHADETASSTFSIDVSAAALQVTAPATATIVLDPASSTFFGSTNITVNVATNNATGYTMTMSVPTTDLTHTEITGNNAPIIPTLQSAAPESTFPANAWGYKVLGDNYNPVQLINTNPSWQTDGPTNGTDHIISLAAKVDGVKQAGVYENTLTFNVVANPNAIRDTIVFNKNNENATGTMESQAAYQGVATKLNKNNFTFSGMRFAGWSTTASGTGEGVRYYGDGSTIITDVGNSSKTVTLYAQWTTLPACANPSNCDVDPEHIPSGGTTGTTFQRAYEIAYTAMHKGMYEEQHEGQGDYALVNSWPPNNESYKNFDVRFAMQDMTPEICASVTAVHDDYQALDIRDNKLYHITKMKDGSCWMTQNLDLDLSTEKELTHADTDLGWQTLDLNATWTPSVNTVPMTSEGAPGFVGDYEPRSGDYGDIWVFTSGNNENDTAYYTMQSCMESNNTTKEICNHYHVGNFYNFSAVRPRSYQYHVTTDSICAAGWRLPLQSGDDYKRSLNSEGIDQYGAIRARTSPFYLVRGGLVDPPNVRYIGADAYYWYGSGYSWAIAFKFGATNIGFGSDTSSYPSYAFPHGMNVRCLAR